MIKGESDTDPALEEDRDKETNKMQQGKGNVRGEHSAVRELRGVESDSPEVSNYFLEEETTKLSLKGCRSFLGRKMGKGERILGIETSLGKGMQEAGSTMMCAGNCKMSAVAGT